MNSTDRTTRQTERDQIKQAMASLGEKRSLLGDEVVEAAPAAMQEKLARLDEEARLQGDYSKARSIYAESLQLLHRIQNKDDDATSPLPSFGIETQKFIATTRAALGEQAYIAAYEAIKHMSLNEALHTR